MKPTTYDPAGSMVLASVIGYEDATIVVDGETPTSEPEPELTPLQEQIAELDAAIAEADATIAVTKRSKRIPAEKKAATLARFMSTRLDLLKLKSHALGQINTGGRVTKQRDELAMEFHPNRDHGHCDVLQQGSSNDPSAYFGVEETCSGCTYSEPAAVTAQGLAAELDRSSQASMDRHQRPQDAPHGPSTSSGDPQDPESPDGRVVHLETRAIFHPGLPQYLLSWCYIHSEPSGDGRVETGPCDDLCQYGSIGEPVGRALTLIEIAGLRRGIIPGADADEDDLTLRRANIFQEETRRAPASPLTEETAPPSHVVDGYFLPEPRGTGGAYDDPSLPSLSGAFTELESY